MRYIKDLREYLKTLDELGELVEIDEEVDWNLEIGAIVRRAYDLRAPAPLFNKIKGIEKGFRVLGGSAGLSKQEGLKLVRIAVSLGFDPAAGAKEIVNTLADSFAKEGIAQKLVGDAHCQENEMTGGDVDLMRLPAPYIHHGDGGRYLNTWGTIVVQTPDKSWTNWSIARIMLLDQKLMTGLVPPQQHLGIIHKMWKDKGEPTPFALVLGAPPAVSFFSGTPFPEHVSEGEVMGAHFGEPVEIVQCKSVDLQVPSGSEIVIEGTISEKETAEEGPMGEFAGYMGEHDTPQPVYNVSAITYRDDPILPIVNAGVPVEDTQTCCGTMYSAAVLAELRKHDFPADTCFLTFESAVHLMVVTVEEMEHTHASAKKLAREAKDIIFNSKPGVDIPKLMLVDNDIDPSDINQVVWAFATRVHPQNDAHFFERQKTLPLLHYLNAAEKKDMSSTKVIFDALLPSFDRTKVSSFENIYPKELQEKVLKNWEKYGF